MTTETCHRVCPGLDGNVYQICCGISVILSNLRSNDNCRVAHSIELELVSF